MMPLRFLLRRLSRRRFSSSAATSNPNSNPNPNPNPDRNIVYTETLSKTIHALFKQQDPDKLVAAFNKASDSYRFRCKHRIYEIAVRRLAAADRPDAVESILEHQKRYFAAADNGATAAREGFAVRIITLYGRAAMPVHATATFHQLPSLLQTPRTVISFNALLTAFLESRDFDRLSETFRDFPSENPSIIPNLVSYNILIQALLEKGEPDSALNAIQLMERNDIVPNLLTFNILLNGYYGIVSRFSDAKKIWDAMHVRGIKPDIKSYNAKMRGLVLGGKTVEAVALVDKLRDVGLKPDTFTFNALIRGYCQDGNLEEAKRVYMDLIKNDCAPNRLTFETLLPYLCETGEIDLAVKLCYESISRRCFTDAAVLQRVVDGLVMLGKNEEAKKLVELGRVNNYPRKRLRMPELVTNA